jgi:hypothetical protein
VIALGKYPVCGVDSVTVDGVLLSETDYICDQVSGLLYRVRNGRRSAWQAGHVYVEYEAGFSPIPATVSRACIDLVRLLRSKSSRDPLLRSLEIPEVITESYWVGDLRGGEGLPADIRTMLERFRVRRLVAA